MEFYQTQYGLLESDALANGSRRTEPLRQPGLLRNDGLATGDAMVPERAPDPRRIDPRAAHSGSGRIAAPGPFDFAGASLAARRHPLYQPGPRFFRAGGERLDPSTSSSQPRAALRSDLLCAAVPRAAAGQLRPRLDESERRLVGYACRRSDHQHAGRPRRRRASIVADELANLNRARPWRSRTGSRRKAGCGSGRARSRSRSDNSGDQRPSPAARRAAARICAAADPVRARLSAGQRARRRSGSSTRRIAREEARVQSSLGDTYRQASTREQHLKQQVEHAQAGCPRPAPAQHPVQHLPARRGHEPPAL